MLFVSSAAIGQGADHVVYKAALRQGSTVVKYCSIAPADVRIPGKVIETRATRAEACGQLVKRLKLGVVYPGSPGSCDGYSKAAASECLKDGVDVKSDIAAAMSRAR